MSSRWQRLWAQAALWASAMVLAVPATVQAQAQPEWNPASRHSLGSCWANGGGPLPTKWWYASGGELDLGSILQEAGLMWAQGNNMIPPNCHFEWVDGPHPITSVPAEDIGAPWRGFFVNGLISHDVGSCAGGAPSPSPMEPDVATCGCNVGRSPPDTVGLGADAHCYCKMPYIWSEIDQACVTTIRESTIPHALNPPPPECEVCKGNPIYPLRGVKREEVDTGLVMGRTTLRFTFDHTAKIPKIPLALKMATGLEQPYGVLGGKLWFSNLHRRVIPPIYMRDGMPSGATFPHATAAVRGDGSSKTFTQDGYNLSPRAEPGVADQLVPEGGGGWRYDDSRAGTRELYTQLGMLTTLLWADGTRIDFTYSDTSTPTSIAPRAGLLTAAVDNRGHSLGFRYGAQGINGVDRLETITDAAGQVTALTYDSATNLAGITWADGRTKTLLYEDSAFPWALTGMTDERNHRYSTFGYDSEGRAVSTEHAGGVDRFSVSYETPPVIQVTELRDNYDNVARYYDWVAPQGTTTTESSGSVSQWTAVAQNGRNYLSSHTQGPGAGSTTSTSSQTYDANGNLASRTDLNGKRSCIKSDAGRSVELVRVDGLEATDSCDSVTLNGAVLPSGALKTSTQWHPDWPLPAKVAEPGRLTTSIYNGQPDPFSGGQTASCAPVGASFPGGQPIAVLCKEVSQATFDASGVRAFALDGQPQVPGDPNGADSNYANVSLLLHLDGSSNATGLVDSSPNHYTVSAFGNAGVAATAARYGSAGLALDGSQGTYATAPSAALDLGANDFTVEAWVRLNAYGNWATLIGNYGNGGARGIEILTGGNGLLHMRWSQDGSSDTASLSHSDLLALNTWAHVAAVRQGTSLRIFLNGVPSAAATVNGAIFTSSTPVNIGRTPDTGSGVWHLNGAVDEVRITKGVARYTAAFTPPTAGLGGAPTIPAVPTMFNTAVADVVRTWTYDAGGRVLTATDADTGTTTFAYHAETNSDHRSSDLKSITNSLGKATTFDRYNRYGQLLQSTDARGVLTVNTYDLRQRLLTNTVGGETTTYAYDEAGQLKKVSFDNGTWVGFDYDDAHRQVAAYDNKANRIDYVLDNAGNQTDQHVKDPSGVLKRGLARAMDALGRAQQSTGRE